MQDGRVVEMGGGHGRVCDTANVLHATEMHTEKWVNDKRCYAYFTPEIMAVASCGGTVNGKDGDTGLQC